MIVSGPDDAADTIWRSIDRLIFAVKSYSSKINTRCTSKKKWDDPHLVHGSLFHEDWLLGRDRTLPFFRVRSRF